MPFVWFDAFNAADVMLFLFYFFRCVCSSHVASEWAAHNIITIGNNEKESFLLLLLFCIRRCCRIKVNVNEMRNMSWSQAFHSLHSMRGMSWYCRIYLKLGLAKWVQWLAVWLAPYIHFLFHWWHTNRLNGNPMFSMNYLPNATLKYWNISYSMGSAFFLLIINTRDTIHQKRNYLFWMRNVDFISYRLKQLWLFV